MADGTAIEWTHRPGTNGETWNPIVGCSVVSPGCTNCYAMRVAGTRLDGNPKAPHYAGTTQHSKAGPVWTGKVATATDHILTKPLRWRAPRTVFVNSMGDLFHEAVPDEWIDRVFAVMALAPQHTFQLLSKRPARMRAYVQDRAVEGMLGAVEHRARQLARERETPIPVGKTLAGTWPWPHVWLGVSVEDQARADARIPDLLATPAAIRFVSYEPALGPVRFDRIGAPQYTDDDKGWTFNALDAGDTYRLYGEEGRYLDSGDGPMRETKIDWVICGGESGPHARPMHPDWARSIRDQCASARVPFFFKQWGEWVPPNHFSGIETCHGSGCPDVAWPDGTIAWGSSHEHGGPGRTLHRVGKKTAGRLLDGRTHDDFPEPAE